jgi:hypothetical protein
MARWPDNEVWEQRDAYNRAPRPALIECEPLHHRYRYIRVVRFVTKFVLYGGFFMVVLVGLFYFASHSN